MCACGTTRTGHAWGADARLLPGRATVTRAAHDALVDPFTWVPLGVAGVLSLGDMDEDISDWARRETPVFGSTEQAEKSSGDLRGLANDAWLLSMLVVPSGDEPSEWLLNKLQGYAVQFGATQVNSSLTGLGKELAQRERPNGENNRSFPSGHTSSAFTTSTLAWRNVEQLDLPENLRWPLRGALLTLGAGTGWARVEAGEHYPTDVLVGAALGNFVANFMQAAFLASEDSPRLQLEIDPGGEALALGLAWAW